MNSKRMFSKCFTLAFGAAPLMCALVLTACGDDSTSAKGTSDIDDSSSNNASENTLTDNRDGHTYKTVTIGAQTWMAENLNYEYNEGFAKSYCYNDKADSCAKYGRLYTWAAAMDSAAQFSTAGKGCGYGKTCSPSGTVRGVCPEGWHLPNDTEWNSLWTAVGGTSTAGTKLKSTSGWYNGGNGTDSSGFSVLPAGYRYYEGFFIGAGNDAYFWSSSERNSDYAYDWGFNYENVGVSRSYDNKNSGLSVRCLRDL